MQRRLSAHYAYIYAHFIIWCFHCGIASPWSSQESSRAVLAGGTRLWQSPPQHLPVRFACSKLRLVGEVFPFDSEFTARGSLTRMRSGTPSKSAKGDFFRQFWQWGAQLWQSPPQHLPVWFARNKMRLVGEVSPFYSEFTARGSLTQMQSGTPSKSAKGDFFRQFWQGVPDFGRVPHSICQFDLLMVNCIW